MKTMKPSLVANLLPNKVLRVCFNIEYILTPKDYQNYVIDVLYCIPCINQAQVWTLLDSMQSSMQCSMHSSVVCSAV